MVLQSIGDLGGANGVTDFTTRTVTVRADTTADGAPPACRGIVEVEAESQPELVHKWGQAGWIQVFLDKTLRTPLMPGSLLAVGAGARPAPRDTRLDQPDGDRSKVWLLCQSRVHGFWTGSHRSSHATYRSKLPNLSAALPLRK